MRLKWLALTFLLGFIVILDPTQTPAQFPPGGDKGKGKGNGKDRGGFGGFTPPAGGGQFPTPGGMPNGDKSGFTRPPGGGFGGPPGGGFGGPPGGGANRFSPDNMWAIQLSRANLPPNSDSIDLNQVSPELRTSLGRMGPMPENGILTKEMFIAAFAAQNDQRARGMGQGPPAVIMINGMGGMGMGRPGNGGTEGWDNGGNGENGSRDRRNDKKEAEDVQPGPIRYGKLPSGLPEWFEEYDINKDGQVELWEWRKSGGTMAEFREYDLNGDDIITADELLRWTQQDADRKHDLAIANGERVLPAQGGGKKGSGGGRTGSGRTGDPQKTDTATAEGDPSDKANEKANAEKNPDKKNPDKKTPDGGPPSGKGPNRGGGNNMWMNGGKPSDGTPPKKKE
jgi:hypothetical protein